VAGPILRLERRARISSLLLSACAIIVWLLREPLFAKWCRARLRRRRFPSRWRSVLRSRVPRFRAMPADLQWQITKHIKVYPAEKAFSGHGGLIAADEMRVAITAQRCSLTLNRLSGYFANLRPVVVYPNAFIVDKACTDAAGGYQSRCQRLSGES
jgi:Mlc titration factor MtfA (ptsG expression regulator)